MDSKEIKYDLVVIGAGVSGLIAAGRAGELGARVLVIEKMRQAGRKLLITGKGRCNITNTDEYGEFISHIHPNGRFLSRAFTTFFSQDIVNLLEDHGLKTNIERGGRIFPETNKAADVLKTLMKWIEKYKVDFIYDAEVKEIASHNGLISGVKYFQEGKMKIVSTSKVVLSTGGKSYPGTGSTGDGYKIAKNVGHKIVDTRQALVPLETREDIPRTLHNLNLKNINATYWLDGKKQKEQFGELIFMDFGLAGPVILTLSRDIVDELNKSRQVEISIDLKPALDDQKLETKLLRDIDQNGKLTVYNLVKMWLPIQLIKYFIERTGIDDDKLGNQLSSKERKGLRVLMKDLRFSIKNPRSFKEAIITAGGINTKEIDPKTMESKILPGLYFAGEIIDIDGDTGGYNLQIAYSTAWLAAESSI